jgi:mycothione reductase
MTTSDDGTMTGMDQFDLVIFGAGSGNSIVSPAIDSWRIAIIEEGAWGGTCLNRGCIPTKMLVHTADTIQSIKDAKRFGIDASLDGVRWPDIRDRVFDRIDPIARSGEEYRRGSGSPNVTALVGHARFIGERQLEVVTAEGPVQVEGKQVVVAAGARPMIPDIPGIDEGPYHTSDDIMRLDRIPEHLVVLGGGFIACELAHVFGAYGADVTIIQRGALLLKAEDHDIAAAITADFSRRFDVRTIAHVERVSWSPQGHVTVHLLGGTMITGSHLLVATGRIPNTDVIDAEACGLKLENDGRICVDEHQRTSVPGVWALGDISSPYMLKHVANHEAKVVAHNIVNPESLRTTNHTAVPHAVFTHPQIASVGMTEAEARREGIDVMISTHKYSDVAFGWALEDTTSFCKLVADRETRRLVGAHIIGPHASSLIQQLIHALVHPVTIEELATGQYYIHPALGEVVENALLGFASQTTETFH